VTAGELARAPIAALAFLTRLPVGRLVELGGDDVGRGAALFPVVGAGVGGGCGLMADALAGPLPPLAAGGLAVGLAALITGAMHLDALADTADALGGQDRERRLEIMRDHAVGAFGAVALVVVCLLDAVALGALAGDNHAALAGCAAGALGRAAMLPLARALPYARLGAGQGRVLDGMGWLAAGLGCAVALLLAAVIGPAALVAAAAAVAVVAILAGVGTHRWLGGVTGDVLGATAKLAETGALLAAVWVMA
jgi:adenosylcobinamide-GDP ribazoletransferase